MPKVSVIITSHNYAQYLPQAVESALAQTLGDVEVIVVDDGSTDDTASIMEKFHGAVRYLHQDNRGVAVARNRGIEEARGEFVAFLDADDYWLPHKLERQISALSSRSDCRASSTAHFPVGGSLMPSPVRRRERVRSLLEALIESGNIVGIPSTVLCERSLFEDVGGFDPELGDCADWDMWIRIAAATRFAELDEPLVAYRLHDRNMTRNVALRERDSLRVLAKAFAMDALTTEMRARRHRILARNYMVLAGSYFHAGSYRDFLRCALRAVTLDLRQAGYPVAFPLRWLARGTGGSSQ